MIPFRMSSVRSVGALGEAGCAVSCRSVVCVPMRWHPLWLQGPAPPAVAATHGGAAAGGGAAAAAAAVEGRRAGRRADGVVQEPQGPGAAIQVGWMHVDASPLPVDVLLMLC